MIKKLYIEVISPMATVFTGEVDEVVAVNEIGEFGVLKDHAPFFTSLKLGELRLRDDDKYERFVISGGFFKVSDNSVTVLTEVCENVKEIDVKIAEGKIVELQTKLEDDTLSKNDISLFNSEIAFNTVAIETVAKYK